MRSTNIELHDKTEKFLKQITEKSNWTLESDKLANWKVKLVYAGVAGTMGLATAWIPPIFSHLNGTPSPYSYSGAILSSGMCMMSILGSAGEKSRVAKLSLQLKEMSTGYKKDVNSPVSRAMSEKLETIINAAKDYTESRSYGEYCLTATLIATGFAGINAEMGYLPESVKIGALVAGIGGTAVHLLYHYIYKSQDLEKISQIANECLKMLEQQKKASSVYTPPRLKM